MKDPGKMQSEQYRSKLLSPDLRFRTSTVLWGPLQLTLNNHREGAELGYEAGKTAYQEEGNTSLEEAMHRYFIAPRYHPYFCTPKIFAEWQAMFLLGWASGLLEEPAPVYQSEQTEIQRRQSRASRPTVAGTVFRSRGDAE